MKKLVICFLVFILFTFIAEARIEDYYQPLVEQGLNSNKISDVHMLSQDCFDTLYFLHIKLYNKFLPLNSYEEFLNKSETMPTRTNMLQPPSEATESEYITGYRRVYFHGKPFEDKVLVDYIKPVTEQMITFSYNFRYGLESCFFVIFEETNFTPDDFYDFQKNETLRVQHGFSLIQKEPTQLAFNSSHHYLFLISKNGSRYFTYNASYIEFNNNMNKLYKFDLYVFLPLDVKEVNKNVENLIIESILDNTPLFKRAKVLNLTDGTTSIVDMTEKYKNELLIKNILYALPLVLIIFIIIYFFKKRK